MRNAIELMKREGFDGNDCNYDTEYFIVKFSDSPEIPDLQSLVKYGDELLIEISIMHLDNEYLLFTGLGNATFAPSEEEEYLDFQENSDLHVHNHPSQKGNLEAPSNRDLKNMNKYLTDVGKNVLILNRARIYWFCLDKNAEIVREDFSWDCDDKIDLLSKIL